MISDLFYTDTVWPQFLKLIIWKIWNQPYRIHWYQKSEPRPYSVGVNRGDGSWMFAKHLSQGSTVFNHMIWLIFEADSVQPYPVPHFLLPTQITCGSLLDLTFSIFPSSFCITITSSISEPSLSEFSQWSFVHEAIGPRVRSIVFSNWILVLFLCNNLYSFLMWDFQKDIFEMKRVDPSRISIEPTMKIYWLDLI